MQCDTENGARPKLDSLGKKKKKVALERNPLVRENDNAAFPAHFHASIPRGGALLSLPKWRCRCAAASKHIRGAVNERKRPVAWKENPPVRVCETDADSEGGTVWAAHPRGLGRMGAAQLGWPKRGLMHTSLSVLTFWDTRGMVGPPKGQEIPGLGVREVDKKNCSKVLCTEARHTPPRRLK